MGKDETIGMLIADICEEFEDFLDERDITIPNGDRTGDETEARIYTDDWDDICYRVKRILDSYISTGSIKIQEEGKQ